jgi:hydrogenase maturation factor
VCLTRPATVLASEGMQVLVDIDGRRQVMTNLTLPDLGIGEVVMVGLGNVLGRLSEPEADELRAMWALAAADGPGPGEPTRDDQTQPA